MAQMTSIFPTEPPSKLHRILIVDDNQLTANALGSVLEAAKYHTAVTYRGDAGLDYARANACAAALVDIHLPDVSGLDVARRMRELWGPRTPIIIMSGDTSMEVINALYDAGATYFFSKPVNIPYLLERMNEWIATSTGGNGLTQ